MVITTTTEKVVKSLSYTEILILRALAERLVEDKAELVSGTLVEQIKASRSVIVTLLAKLSAAGVVESRSMGMKGLAIRVLNRPAFDEIVKEIST